MQDEYVKEWKEFQKNFKAYEDGIKEKEAKALREKLAKEKVMKAEFGDFKRTSVWVCPECGNYMPYESDFCAKCDSVKPRTKEYPTRDGLGEFIKVPVRIVFPFTFLTTFHPANESPRLSMLFAFMYLLPTILFMIWARHDIKLSTESINFYEELGEDPRGKRLGDLRKTRSKTRMTYILLLIPLLNGVLAFISLYVIGNN